MSSLHGEGRRPIDWGDLKRRLRAMGHALESGGALDSRQAARLLADRARELARPIGTEEPQEEAISIVSFTSGGEAFAVDTRSARGVFRLTELAPLPGASAEVAGVTLWRGELLLVLDVQQLLGLAGSGLDDRAWVVAIGDERRSRGLLAGKLGDLGTLTKGDLSEPERQTKSAGASTSYVRGVTADAMQLLDATALLELEI
jgi:purine-binding chemotaxis protein CheW